MELTLHQQRVTDHTEGHALCIAVAGSGKTTTLAYLIKNLLLKGADPRRVMVMMFNKSAQLDFSRKLEHIIDSDYQIPEVRTYHSTGLRLLKSLEKWRLRGPYDHNPLSEKEVELKIRELLIEFAPDTHQDRIKNDTARYVEAAVSFIEIVKSNLLTADIAFETSDYPESFRFFTQIFSEFEQWRHDNRRITFTDMLYDTVCLIENNKEVIGRFANKMSFIVVDEYQDTSTLQHRLTRIIAGERAQVIAVGDPDQTIYEFAGANINNILHHFEQDYAETGAVTQLSMPHTFRYGHSIALAASHLISQNRDRKNVTCIAHEQNAPSSIEVIQSKHDEIKEIIRAIREHQAQSGDAIAILVRVWAQAVPLELSLLTNNLSYHSDGPSLFDRPEITSLLYALELAAGQFQFLDTSARGERFYQLFTMPHLGIKNGLIKELIKSILPHAAHYGNVMANAITDLQGISDYQRKKLYGRSKIITYLEEQKHEEKAATVLENYIRRTELKESIQSMSLNDQRTEEQLLAIDGFLSWVRQNAGSVVECYYQIDQLRYQRKQRNTAKSSQSHPLVISSCHRAKGLEWPVVFIPGLTSRYWPFKRSDELAASGSEDLEAERRLLYVAMTRARKKLQLFTCPGSLTKKTSHWGSSSSEEVSRFLREMKLSAVNELSPLLIIKDLTALKTFFSCKGLTPQSKIYLSEILPELRRDIESAPTPSELERKNKPATASNPGYLAARQRIFNKQESQTNMPWKQDARLRHSIFGKGQVIEVNDSSFVIMFEVAEHGVKRFARSEQILHLFEPA